MHKLESVPERFYAPELVSLLLGGNSIVSLAASFFSGISKLRVLDLSGGEFRNLPEELGDLKDLVWLDLSCCECLEILPNAIGKLHVLKCLNLAECRMLKYVPSGVVRLTSLQVLDTTLCENLTWAEHTPPGMARAESLGPTIGASLEDICGLVVLTKLSIFRQPDPGVEFPHNISALTRLKTLWLRLDYIKTLPAEMPSWFIQLQELHLWSFKNLEYLPRSFTCSGAFPALIYFQLYVPSLLEFQEVDEGALPKLRTLDFSGSDSLGTLPLSLNVLSSLMKLILLDCQDTLKDSCRTYCEKSSIWRRFDIQYEL
jgi:Leucine-rich repeat (LRR) protein